MSDGWTYCPLHGDPSQCPSVMCQLSFWTLPMADIPIPYKPYERDNITPLTWHRSTFDGVPTVYLVCECGRRIPLSTSHEIADDGTVTPSVWHDAADGGCGYHKSGLKLVDMPPCSYKGCTEPAHGPPPPNKAWHLCKTHQDELNALTERGDIKALLGWWARGTDKERVAREIAGRAGALLKELGTR